jgi:hypothetical protein
MTGLIGRSDGYGELDECYAELMAVGDVSGEFIMPAVEILDEGVAGAAGR